MKKFLLIIFSLLLLFTSCNLDNGISIFSELVDDVPDDAANYMRVIGRYTGNNEKYKNELILSTVNGITIGSDRVFPRSHIAAYFIDKDTNGHIIAYFHDINGSSTSFSSVDLDAYIAATTDSERSAAITSNINIGDVLGKDKNGTTANIERIYDIKYYESSNDETIGSRSYSIIGQSGSRVESNGTITDNREYYSIYATYTDTEDPEDQDGFNVVYISGEIDRGDEYRYTDDSDIVQVLYRVPRIIGPRGAYSFFAPSADITDRDDYPYYYKTSHIVIPVDGINDNLKDVNSSLLVEAFFNDSNGSATDGVVVAQNGQILKRTGGQYTPFTTDGANNSNIGDSYGESIQVNFPLVRYNNVIYGLNQSSTRRYFSIDMSQSSNIATIHSIQGYSHYDALGLYYYTGSYFFFPTGNHSLRYIDIESGTVQSSRPSTT